MGISGFFFKCCLCVIGVGGVRTKRLGAILVDKSDKVGQHCFNGTFSTK